MGAIILMMTYGYPVQENDDPYVKTVDAALNGLAEITVPGAFLVDSIPLREWSSLLSRAAGGMLTGATILLRWS
jgi:hypothetical protein